MTPHFIGQFGHIVFSTPAIDRGPDDLVDLVGLKATERRGGRISLSLNSRRYEATLMDAADDKLRRRQVGRSAPRCQLSARQAAGARSQSRVRRRARRRGHLSGPQQPQRRQLVTRRGWADIALGACVARTGK